MDEIFNQLFAHYISYKIIICRKCRHAVVPQNTRTHLQAKHRELTPRVRSEIVRYIEQLDYLAWIPEEVCWPEPDSSALIELLTSTGGFRCVAPVNGLPCGFTCGGETREIHRHCREEHGWSNARGRGRRPTEMARERYLESVLWVSGIDYQRPFLTGGRGWMRCIQVSRARYRAESATTLDEDVTRTARETLKRKLGEYEVLSSHETVKGWLPRYESNPWLQRTGWLEFATGLRQADMLQLVRVPDDREPLLQEVYKTAWRVIRRARANAHPRIVGYEASAYVAGCERPGDRGSLSAPLYTGQKSGTISKYAAVWAKMLCYVWRSEYRRIQEPESKPLVRLSGAQRDSLERIRIEVDRINREGDESSSGPSDESDDESDDEGDDESDDESGGVTDRQNNDKAGGAICTESRLDRAVRYFLLSAIKTTVKDTTYNDPLHGTLAILGIEDKGGWKSALAYTPVLSAVITVAKMLVLDDAVRERARLLKAAMESGTPRDDVPGCYELVKPITDAFLGLNRDRKAPPPLEDLIRLRSYGLTIRRETNAEGCISWSGERIQTPKGAFSMAELRSMIHGVVNEARSLLFENLLLLDTDASGDLTQQGKATLPRLSLADVSDDQSESRPGWSVFEDARNPFPVDRATWLHDRVVGDESVRYGFIDVTATVTSGKTVWNRQRVRDYGAAQRRFEELLAVLCHTTAGQPARATELFSIAVENSVNGTPRGVFVDDGMLALATSYHKGEWQSGRPKVVHRYLPEDVGRLVFLYLWLVRPFWDALAVTSGEAKRSRYIWRPDEDGEPPEEGVPEHGGESEEGDPAPKRRRSGTFDEGRWNTDTLRRALVGVTRSHLGVPITVQIWRHVSIAIYRRFVSDDGLVDLFERVGAGEEVELTDTAADLQAAHSTMIANKIYGRLVNESTFHERGARLRFRRVSSEWHALFGFFRGAPTLQTSRTVSSAAVARWARLSTVDLKRQLAQLVGEGAYFRGVQEAAIEAVVSRKSPIVAVMSTGGGKSLLFALPAAASPEGITIVVVPLISLRADMLARFRKLGITCVEWDSRKAQEWAQIVLVTPEAVVSDAFSSFLNRIEANGRLDRIVVDECHVLLDARSGWRKRVLELANLGVRATQFLYLTATLPPTREHDFISAAGLPDRELVHWFRAPTTRSNIAYDVRLVPPRSPGSDLPTIEYVTAIVKELSRRYPAPGRILVYCRSVGDANAYATRLRCPSFHRNTEAMAKATILQALTKTGDGPRIFTATSALGLGIDAPNIRAIVHAGAPRSLVEFAQESGRAGRDGNPSDSVIVAAIGSRYDDPDIAALVDNNGCKRVLLDRVMDGRQDRRACEKGERSCHQCATRFRAGNRQSLVSSQAQPADNAGQQAGQRARKVSDRIEAEEARLATHATAVRSLQRSNALFVDRLTTILERCLAGCPLCTLLLGRCEPHTLDSCDDSRKQAAVNLRTEWLASVNLDKYSGCFRCFLPWAACPGWVERSDKPGQYRRAGSTPGCRWKRTEVLGLLASAITAGSLRGIGGLNGSSLASDTALQLGRRVLIPGGIETNRICELLVHLED